MSVPFETVDDGSWRRWRCVLGRSKVPHLAFGAFPRFNRGVQQHHHLACDLGAESGRLILGTLSQGHLVLEELHRFANGAKPVGDALCWDIDQLVSSLKEGLRSASKRSLPIASLSTDSWGVDYVLVDGDGRILKPVYHYRDSRCQRGLQRAHERVSQEVIFAETGIQFMAINTLFQLASEPLGRLQQAKHLLMIADAFNFLLCGVARVEVSNASTSQLYNPITGTWSERLLRSLELPEELFPPIVASGTPLGPLHSSWASELGLPRFEIIAGCSHDTGAAVVAVPAKVSGSQTDGPPDWAYLSSGTWSLLGCELTAPNLSEACREANFTNEIGFGNTVRLLKNIAGLWLVQECRRAWAAEGVDYSYAQLAELAAAAVPFRSLVHPADERFVAPGGMPQRISDFCIETGQPVPRTPGEFVRCCLESLALAYAENLEQLAALVGTRFHTLHIVGGGSQNELLNQFAADASGMEVVAGPVEATAAGNILVQGIALGHVASLSAARDIVRASFPVKTFVPRSGDDWSEPKRRFARIRP